MYGTYLQYLAVYYRPQVTTTMLDETVLWKKLSLQTGKFSVTCSYMLPRFHYLLFYFFYF